MALTVKGAPATQAQIDYVNQIIKIGRGLNASPTAMAAVIVEAIAESTLGVDMGWDGSNPTYGGLLAGNIGNFGFLGNQTSDAVTVAEINAAFQGGRGFAGGGAMGLAAGSNDVLQIAMTNSGSGTQFLSEAGHENWAAEAQAFLTAAGAGTVPGGTAGAGGSGTTPNQDSKGAPFTVGDTSNPDEDYFTAINRLAQSAYWYAFSDGETFYVADGTLLMAQHPAIVISRFSPDVLHISVTYDNTAFQFASHHKHKARIQKKATLAKVVSPVEATVQLICPIDAVRGGDVVQVVGTGPGDGRWLVGDCKRSILDVYSELTLVPALAPIDAAAGVGSSKTGKDKSGASGNASVDQAVSAAQQLSALGVPYLLGGGHHPGELDNPHPANLDCSGETCWILHRAGMFPANAAAFSGDLATSWGQPGEGQSMTVWANADHVFIEFKLPSGHFQANTSGLGPGPRFGPWGGNGQADASSGAFTPRHWQGT